MAIATLGFAAAAVGGVFALRPVSANALQATTLNGFTTPGASVNVTEKQMRFEINLSAAAAGEYADELAAKTLESGVIVVPYDIYVAQGLSELTVDTAIASKADVSSLWEQDGDVWKSYAFLPADLIPEGQENRVLVARGYIVDGENVYYTNEVKSSMAYVAWQNLANFPDDQELLKSYMGPYTLTYGEGQAISNLYYGDEVTGLPTEIDGTPVEGWFWDEGLTDDVAAGDYATGSMNVYYKLAPTIVSGKITCDSNIALDEATFTVDGQAVAVDVDVQGNFSFKTTPGEHTFVVRADGHKAVVTQTLAAGETNTLNVKLLDATFEVGTFGNMTDLGYQIPENFNGVYTVTDNNGYILPMPNTATKSAFEFTVKTSGTTYADNEGAVGLMVTNGNYVMSFTIWQWGMLRVNISQNYGFGLMSGFYLGKNQAGAHTYKLVRTPDKYEFWIDGTMFLRLTPDGANQPANKGTTSSLIPANDTAYDPAGKQAILPFFGENVTLAVGLASRPTSGVQTSTTYTCESFNKYETVTGTIAENSALDLTKTTLKVDGVECDMTVAADGSFTAYVPAGTHTFAFANGAWGDTVENVTVVEGANAPISVTLEDYTYVVGSYGNHTSNTPTSGSAATATYTYEGAAGGTHAYIFPNTATTEDFEFTITTTNVTANNDRYFGIILTNGTNSLMFGFAQWQYYLNVTSGLGAAFNSNYAHGNNVANATCKVVVTSESIEVYVNSGLRFTITATGVTSPLSEANWSAKKFTNADGLALLATFFGENKAPIAVGVGAYGCQGKVTYACNWAII